MANPVYFTDAADVQFRVFDAEMHGGRMMVANPPARCPTFRAFHPESRERWHSCLRLGR